MKNIIEIASEKGLKEFEVFNKNTSKSEISFENNKLKSINTIQNSGNAIRGIFDNKIGLCSFTHGDDANSAVERLIESSKFSEDKQFEFAQGLSFNAPKIFENSSEKVSTEQLVNDGQHMIEMVKAYDKDILANVSFSSAVSEVSVSNSNGVNGNYKKSSFSAYLSGQLIEGTNFIETDCYTYGIRREYDKEKLVNTFIERMKYARTLSNMDSGKTKVLFTPKAFLDILETIAEGVNGSMIEKGISPLCGRIGETIFDERFSAVDDGTLDDSTGSRPLDDEGVPTKRNYIFKNGVLKSYIHTLKTAAKTNDQPTGNGTRSSYDSLPTPDFNNIIIEPGIMSFEEMLHTMQNGIIIDEILGLGMNNLLNGDFGGNIQMGFKVANGKIEGRIKNAVFNSNIYKILKDDLIELSNLNYTHPLVNSVFTTIKNPCALFKNINITIK